jgi:hypothetical protein
MTNKTHTKRRLRAFIRSPKFYFGKLRERICGVDESFVDGNRERYPPGSHEWLVLSEMMYGGIQKRGARWKDDSQIAEHTPICDCIGGDRMSPHHHAYGRSYAEFLVPFLARRSAQLTVAEIGIFNGNGLARWCDLFPAARVLGLDLDLSNFEANRPKLEQLGAFSKNRPELHPFDQLDVHAAHDRMQCILDGAKVDIAIDDGHHSIRSIEITFEALHPHLAENFVYFIEDNFDTCDLVAPKYPQYRWHQRGELTVVTPKSGTRK